LGRKAQLSPSDEAGRGGPTEGAAVEIAKKKRRRCGAAWDRRCLCDGGVDKGGNEDTPLAAAPGHRSHCARFREGRPKPLLAVAGADGGADSRKEEAKARRGFFLEL
jgi:hypothetical protein